MGGAALEIRIAPAQRRLDLQAYTSILSEVRKALQEVDRIAIPQRTARLNWAITKINMDQEIRMILEPKMVPVRRELSSLVVPTDGLVSGVRSLSREAIIPAFFTDSTVHRIGLIGKHILAGEIDHVSMASAYAPSDAAVVNQATTVNADRATEPVKAAISTITGTLEVLERRRNHAPRAFIRVDGTSHAVRIEAKADQTTLLREAWGDRVRAEGLLKRNIAGQPVVLELSSLEPVPERDSSINPWDLLGIDPEFTGGLSTAEFIEQVRRA
jgi:hypothetical protein